ncbi:MAG: flavodoxin domain-containing protein [Candidatus Omnitrophota bacterium]
MNPVEIKPKIYWVGVVDWGVRSFHGHTYTTQRGTTYNAYLIVDEKVALVDTVYGPFAAEMIERIRAVIDPVKIDYVIANHVEADHSGALPELMKLCPKAKVIGTEKCRDGLFKHYYQNWDFQTVKTGDKLSLGKRTLTFVEAPMIHWPDSMFTYCAEEELLMPNDAFGQHLASSVRFADQVDQCALWEEAKKYYANILWPLGSVIARKIDEVVKMNIAVSMIAPSHGLIWRANPMQVVQQYAGWAKQDPGAAAVIVYETMWRATEKMARKIAEGVTDAGVPVKLYNIAESDRTEVIADMLEAKGFLFGSSTHDNDMLPNIAGFLELVKGFKPKNRLSSAFGSYGWAGGAVKEMEGVLKEAGIELALPGISFKFLPDETEYQQCYSFGRSFGELLK